MKYDLFRKGFVAGMIILLIGASVVPIVNCGFLRNDDVSTTLKTRTIPSAMNIITVDDEGDGDYTSIQDAIDNASEGDTIEVYSGIYYENVDVDKTVNLTGVDSELGNGNDVGKPIIDGRGKDDNVVLVKCDYVEISGFYIRNCSIGFSGVRLLSNFTNIRNNIISSCGGGIDLWLTHNITVYNNSIVYNNWGIYFDSCDNCQIKNNSIIDNIYGIELGSSSIEIRNNTVKNNSKQGILQLSCNHVVIQENCILSNGDVGIQLFSSYDTFIVGNIIEDNVHSGISLINSNENNIHGNYVRLNNDFGIYTTYSLNNLIYNNFFDNENNAWDNGDNSWNISKTPGTNIIGGSNLGGNYWSDYTGVDIDGDGLGNTPYYLSGGNNKDNHPLMNEITPPELSIDQPRKGYRYILGNELWPIPSGKTIIWSIGGFDINVVARDHESGVEKVEFYIDDESKPREVEYNQGGDIIFSWHWDETMFGEKHTIKTIAYDMCGNNATSEITVVIWNLHLPSPPGLKNNEDEKLWINSLKNEIFVLDFYRGNVIDNYYGNIDSLINRDIWHDINQYVQKSEMTSQEDTLRRFGRMNYFRSRNTNTITNSGNTVIYDGLYDPDIIVPDDYPTIQEAIDNAGPGFCIWVRSGTYYENIVVDVNALKIIGDSAIIDGKGSGNVVEIKAFMVNINNFTIANGSIGVTFVGTSPIWNTIEYNLILNNIIGMEVTATARSNTVAFNYFLSNDIAIKVDGSFNRFHHNNISP